MKHIPNVVKFCQLSLENVFRLEGLGYISNLGGDSYFRLDLKIKEQVKLKTTSSRLPLPRDIALSWDNVLRNNELSASKLILREENIYWQGHVVFLSELYFELKSISSFYRLFQWFSPSKKIYSPGESGWPVIPSDGWVFNSCTMELDNYGELAKNWQAKLFGCVGVPSVIHDDIFLIF